MPPKLNPQSSPLLFKVLGRTLEHFGVQMYKRREIAIAELVANCWDAGAQSVHIEVPEESKYNHLSSKIVIRDSGYGMSHDEVQDAYLVLGRNRRLDSGEEVQSCLPLDFSADGSATAPSPKKRRVMGRKGIGKLAGFGLAKKMTVTTWQSGSGLEFYLNLEDLKLKDNDSHNVPISWKWIEPRHEFSTSGTIITLEVLKHKSPLDIETLRSSLARRFSRTVHGEMEIKVNNTGLPDPTPPLDKRVPEARGHLTTATLTDGNEVRFWYGFASDPIHNRELRGFTIMVHGKVAQAPPFFFEVEAKASGQHSTRYLLGEIEADFVDNGCDDESDLVSTDRQEIDWEAERVSPLKKWGDELIRKLLIECTKFKGEETAKKILSDPILKQRVDRLDPPSQKQIKGFLKILGSRDDDEARTSDLAGALVRAYEFRQFHDVISEIEAASHDPDQLAKLLDQLHNWKVLESRAILEIIKGRLEIIEKFHAMLCTDAPETASSRSPENLHDLIGSNPWLLNPEWQVLAEEKSITKQLREWGQKDLPDFNGRYDFLALRGDGLLVIIEIKRAGHPAGLDEMNKLIFYQDKLSHAHGATMKMVFICGRAPDITTTSREGFDKNPHYEIRYWSTLFEQTRKIYEHYRAVLEGSVNEPGFRAKEAEVQRTRELLAHGIHRGVDERAKGIPPQDVSYDK
jgi:hypothetical protein